MAHRAMHAGIFAAGVGARLGSSAGRPKGLTPVGGRPLIEWILDDLRAAGVSDTVVIINEESIALRDHVRRSHPASAVRWIVETTPSSMHSFLRVMETLAAEGDEGPFLISTVDTVAPPGTFRRFVELAGRAQADVVLALTTRIEDENPLRVELGSDPDYASTQGLELERNQGLTPNTVAVLGCGPYATAGYYLVRSTVLAEAAAGRHANLGALRQFFKHLFETGYRLSGIVMPDSVDVDRPEDLEAAERLLRATAI